MERDHWPRRSLTTTALVVLWAAPLLAQTPRDTLAWTTRQQSFTAPGCTGRECSSVKLAWPDFGRRAGATARVNELLLISLVDGDDTGRRHRSVTALADAFLTASRSSDSAGMPWDATRTISVLCNTPSRVLLETDEYSFTGGAHGTMYSHFQAFTPGTGARISDRAMVPLATRAALTPIVERAFRRERELPATGSLIEAGYNFKDDRFDLGLAFLAVCGSSLFVHWNAYAIAPYAAGPTHLVIPLDSVPALRR
jgi:hypothetical protein